MQRKSKNERLSCYERFILYMNKMKIIHLLIGCLLVVLLNGCVQVTKSQEESYVFEEGQELAIAIITDIHYLSDTINDHGQAFEELVESGDGKQLNEVVAIIDAFVEEMKKAKPDIIVVSGDLTTNGAMESHIALADKLSELEEAGAVVYVTPGNHDVNNPWARGFKGNQQVYAEPVDSREFSELYGAFGFDEAKLRDKDSLSYLVTPAKDLWILMLDANKYEKNQQLGYPKHDGEFSLETKQWIKECMTLADIEGATVIPVMHHNILTHSEVIQDGYTLNNNEEVIDLFMNNKNNVFLSGHIHIQDICSEFSNGKTLYDIATNALSVYPHQYGLLSYSTSEEVFSYNTENVDVEGWALNEGLEDENLLEFENYSKSYFGEFAYNLAFNKLIHYDHYTKEEINLMSEAMRELNLRYFAGTEGLNQQDIISSKGYQLLSQVEGSFLKTYAENIINDKDMDDNYLTFKINE